MNNLQRISRRFAYHHWAADRAAAAFAVLSAPQLDEPWGGSFGTGRALLFHVIGVERLWFDRWSDASARAIPTFPDTHSGADLRDEWNRIKADQRRYVDTLTEAQLAGDLAYSNLKGEPQRQPLMEILEHVVNHGTYHRGQIAHLLRDRGVAAPGTDYLVFMREQPLR